MPNWSDENGRYWWRKPGTPWWEEVEVPHIPGPPAVKGCTCPMCEWYREKESK